MKLNVHGCVKDEVNSDCAPVCQGKSDMLSGTSLCMDSSRVSSCQPLHHRHK